MGGIYIPCTTMGGTEYVYIGWCIWWMDGGMNGWVGGWMDGWMKRNFNNCLKLFRRLSTILMTLAFLIICYQFYLELGGWRHINMRTCIPLQYHISKIYHGNFRGSARFESVSWSGRSSGPSLFSEPFAKYIKEVWHLMVHLLYNLPEAQAKGPN